MLGCMVLGCACITAVHICHSKWAPTPVTPMTKGLGTSTLVAPIVEVSERVGVRGMRRECGRGYSKWDRRFVYCLIVVGM